MQTTLLSSKGQIVIPKALRDEKQWSAGTEFSVEATVDGLILHAIQPAKKLSAKQGIAKLRSYFQYKGKPITDKQIDEAIAIGVKRRAKRYLPEGSK